MHRLSTRIYRASAWTRGMTWIGEERIAIGSLPDRDLLARARAEGVTHIVNCRARLQTRISQDLWASRRAFGADRVIHAPMWDSGRPQSPDNWADGALFAAAALDDDPEARVLIHCQQGRRRSAMVTYATLRLRGRSPEAAAAAILDHRLVAQVVPEYRASVEDWLANRAGDADFPRITR